MYDFLESSMTTLDESKYLVEIGYLVGVSRPHSPDKTPSSCVPLRHSMHFKGIRTGALC